MALLPSATLFRAGDELRLDIPGHGFFVANPIFGAGPADYLASRPGKCTLFTGGPNGAHLLIPEIPAKG